MLWLGGCLRTRKTFRRWSHAVDVAREDQSSDLLGGPPQPLGLVLEEALDVLLPYLHVEHVHQAVLHALVAASVRQGVHRMAPAPRQLPVLSWLCNGGPPAGMQLAL